MTSSKQREWTKEYPTVREQKKSGHPTQPGNRSNASSIEHSKRKRSPMIHRPDLFFKRNWYKIFALVLAVICAIIITSKLTPAATDPVEPSPEVQEFTIQADDVASVEPVEEAAEGIFKVGYFPVDWQDLTNAWAAELGYEKRYDLTDAERWEVASVVTAETTGEPFAGMVAVAQCILQSCEDDGIRPIEAVVKYQYASSRPEPSEEALEAVQAVFDFGQVATHQPIKYFYAPALVQSEFHESQDYVMTINNHKFFSEKEQ